MVRDMEEDSIVPLAEEIVDVAIYALHVCRMPMIVPRQLVEKRRGEPTKAI